MTNVEFLLGLLPFLGKLGRTEQSYVRDIRNELAFDPCDGHPTEEPRSEPRFYRLSGPLNPYICGGHMKDRWRVAYTVPSGPQGRCSATVIYVDRYVTGIDPWDDLHALLGEQNPPDNHDKPPCCSAPHKPLPLTKLDAFEAKVSRFLIQKHTL